MNTTEISVCYQRWRVTRSLNAWADLYLKNQKLINFHFKKKPKKPQETKQRQQKAKRQIYNIDWLSILINVARVVNIKLGFTDKLFCILTMH